ncbi:hypothetical protein EJ110_NYTH21565 [Nymphaea thermarum]|nr:hypothetical protein EJ110_NYTH21565 [Nymphaea thermarum]
MRNKSALSYGSKVEREISGESDPWWRADGWVLFGGAMDGVFELGPSPMEAALLSDSSGSMVVTFGYEENAETGQASINGGQSEPARSSAQRVSWADQVAGRQGSREEDLPPLQVIEGTSSKVSGNISKLLSGLCSLWMGRVVPHISILSKGDFLVCVSNEEELSLIIKRREWRVGGGSSRVEWRLPRSRFLNDDNGTNKLCLHLGKIPIQSSLLAEVEIGLGEGWVMLQPMVYEGRLRFCRACGVNTHPRKRCPKRSEAESSIEPTRVLQRPAALAPTQSDSDIILDPSFGPMLQRLQMIREQLGGGFDDLYFEGRLTNSLKAGDIWSGSRLGDVEESWRCNIWNKDAHPRSRWFTYVSCEGRLPTQDCHKKKGMPCANTCLVCCLTEDSHSHLSSPAVWCACYGG